MYFYPPSSLYVSGSFTSIEGVYRYGFANYNTDTNLLGSLNPPLYLPTSIWANSTMVVVGAGSLQMGSVIRSGVVGFNATTGFPY